MSQARLPERHFFKYRAWAPWPHQDSQQLDWVDGVGSVEAWLLSSVGPHYETWRWLRVDLAQQGQCLGVAFLLERDRTLFLLRWSS